jgi:hypothetical protein
MGNLGTVHVFTLLRQFELRDELDSAHLLGQVEPAVRFEVSLTGEQVEAHLCSSDVLELVSAQLARKH